MNKIKDINEFKSRLLHSFDFDLVALELFQFQYQHNKVYRMFCDHISRSPRNTNDISQVPFLPISIFKKHLVSCRDENPTAYFRSSGTTSQKDRSTHALYDPKWYRMISKKIFSEQFNLKSPLVFLAALPGYEQRSDASLLFMVDHLIDSFGIKPQSGFYGKDWGLINSVIKRTLEESYNPILIWGVTHALLEMVDKLEDLEIPRNKIMVIETGGMKGMGKELVKDELFLLLRDRFNTEFINSEYGMTELFSQAYACKSVRFLPGFTMRVFARSIQDPFQNLESDDYGLLKIIDLANVDTCAFIETEDVGRVFADGSFEISGRLDNSEMRGCNLMRF